MRGDSAFIMSQAVQLIAAGGHYQRWTLREVVSELLSEADALDSYYAEEDGSERETVQ